MTDTHETHERNVVRLPADPIPEPVEEPSPPGRLHGALIAGMALSALIGTAAMFAFITVGLPDSAQRYVVGVLIFSVLAFLVCASAAVFSAARETYPAHSGDDT